MTRRILITGGRGYLGGRLAQRLASLGTTVVLGSRRGGRAEWLPSASIVPMEWTLPSSLRAACESMDTVVHCASINEQACREDPKMAQEVNAGYTSRLLEAANASGVRRFLYVSTIQVYGNPLSGDIDETRSPSPPNAYAASHLAAEDFVRARATGSMTGIVARLANGFGVPPHSGADCWTLLVNDLCRQAVVRRELTLKSAGLQLRDFIPLEDACRALSHLMELPTERVGSGLFNVGSGTAVRVVDMAERIRRRAEAMLACPLPLIRPEPAPDESWPAFRYRTDKLGSSGFQLETSPDTEIDATLHFCDRHFVPTA